MFFQNSIRNNLTDTLLDVVAKFREMDVISVDVISSVRLSCYG